MVTASSVQVVGISTLGTLVKTLSVVKTHVQLGIQSLVGFSSGTITASLEEAAHISTPFLLPLTKNSMKNYSV